MMMMMMMMINDSSHHVQCPLTKLLVTALREYIMLMITQSPG